VDLYIHSPIRLHGVVLNYFSIRNYWVFEHCPSSGILKTREHDVSGPQVSGWVGDTYSVRSLRKS
jgi:hypothetical protein